MELDQKLSPQAQQFHDTIEAKICELADTKMLTQEVSMEIRDLDELVAAVEIHQAIFEQLPSAEDISMSAI